MAFDVLRQTLGRALHDKLSQKTPTGQAELLGQQLRNRMMAQQIEQLFPLQMAKLQKEIDFMISDPEKQAAELDKQTRLENLKAGLEKDILDYRFAGEKQLKAIPSKHVSVYEGGGGGDGGRAGSFGTIEIYKDAEGNQTDVPHLWRVDAEKRPVEDLGVAGVAKAPPPLSVSEQNNARYDLLGRKGTRQRDEIPESNEFKELRNAMKFNGGKDEFLNQLIATGFPRGQYGEYSGMTEAQIRSKYPQTVATVEAIRQSTIGSVERPPLREGPIGPMPLPSKQETIDAGDAEAVQWLKQRGIAVNDYNIKQYYRKYRNAGTGTTATPATPATNK